MEPKKLQWKKADAFGIDFVVLVMLFVSGCQGATSTTNATTITTPATTTMATTTVTATGKIDVLTYHYDNLRDGVDSDETILTPQNVNSTSFGKLFSVPVDGDVYAQPLYVSDLLMPDGKIHDVMFVVTEHDSLYAIDANNGAILWQDSFTDPNNGIVPVPSADTQTEDITPEVGITGTPVIDATTSTIYFVSNVKNTNNDTYAQYLHAIDLVTGKEKFNGPELISASVKNADGTTISFDPLLGNQRSALLLLDGTVYIAWASHGDNGDYHGWIMSYSTQNVSQQLGVLITTLNGSEGGVWMAGGGLSSDGTYIFAGVANGTCDPSTQDYGDSMLKLSPNNLKIIDSFSAFNYQELNSNDDDFASAEPLLIQSGLTSLVITADKLGVIYVLDQNNLGGYGKSKNNDVQEISVGNTPIMNNMAFFNGQLYVGANNMPLESFELSLGIFNTTPVSVTQNEFGNGGEDGQGTNPVISSNGSGDGIIWALDNTNLWNGPTVLHAYDANNLSDELYNSAQVPGDAAGNAEVFTSPLVVNGKVIVTGVNTVTVYGLK
jgi:hypothetical protein